MTMDVFAVGSVLPWLRDMSDDRGRALNWRDSRRNHVVLFTHAATCQQCVGYARDLLERHDQLGRWDGDLWLAGDSVDAEATPLHDVVRVTGVDERRLRTVCGLLPDDARVIVADRWGQIWQSAAADDAHVLTDIDDMVQTTRHMALQCPECETLDEPVGDWSRIP